MRITNFKKWRSRCKLLLAAITLFALTCYLNDYFDRKNVVSLIGPFPIRRVEIDPRQFPWMDNSTAYDYNFGIVTEPQKTKCPTELFVVVPSAPRNIERRRAIRQTWARDVYSREGSALIFSLGKSDDAGLVTDLRYELETHNDVIVFDFVDSYDNATLKTVLSVRHAARCQPAYFVKADDDTYVNVERLLRSVRLVEEYLKKPFFAGQVHRERQPHRLFSKWSVNRDEYPEESYPPYISGNLYVISGSLLPSVAATALRTRYLHLEDVFLTGLVATKLNIPRVSLEGVWEFKRWFTHNCAHEQFISSHYVDASQMLRIDDERHTLVQSCASLGFISWCSCVPKIAEIFVSS